MVLGFVRGVASILTLAAVGCSVIVPLGDHELAPGDSGLTQGTVDGGPANFGEAVVLAKEQTGPSGIAVSSAGVFFVTNGTRASVSGVNRDGTKLRIVYTPANPPCFQYGDLAADAQRIYWTECGRVISSFFDGSSGRGYYSDNAEALRFARVKVDALNVYASQVQSVVYQFVKDGSARNEVANDGKTTLPFAPGDSDFFWAEGGIVKTRPFGGTAVVFAVGQPTTVDMLADTTYLFSITQAGTLLRQRRDAAGGAPDTLAKGLRQPARMVLDDNSVYFTDAAAGTVNRVPKAGGDLVVIASGQAAPYGIAVDAQGIYWTNRDDGTVMMAPRK